MLENQRAGAHAPGAQIEKRQAQEAAGVTIMEPLRGDAQEALDDLWAKHGIPFKLTAYEVEAAANPDYYTVRFHDSRLPSLFIYWNPKESFKTAVRDVVERTVGKRRTA